MIMSTGIAPTSGKTGQTWGTPPDVALCHTRDYNKGEETIMAKRNVFGELMEGVAAMKADHKGKLTLRSYKIDPTPLPKVDSKLIRETRKKLRCSRAVFARKLRINERTLEKWEQGRAKPNPQAAALVLLVRKYPDTLERLERVAGGSPRETVDCTYKRKD
jgi:putative transcriptional regulator